MTGSTLRRMLIVIAIRDYPDGDPAFGAGVDEQIDTVRAWWAARELEDRRFTMLAPQVGSRAELERFIHDSGLRSMAESDAVVLYVTGHGVRTESNRHYLLLPDSDERRPVGTGFPTAELLAALLDSHAGHVLVIVNSCFAGTLRDELTALRRDLRPERRRQVTLAVMASADFDETPRVRELAELLDLFGAQLRERSEFSGPHLSPVEFRRELRATARAEGLLEPVNLWADLADDQTEPSLCLPNPHFRAEQVIALDARRQVIEPYADYWMSRASGRVDDSDTGWYFSGRDDLNRRMAGFLRRSFGTLVVTGAAGTGKSALLARAVAFSDRLFRERFPELLAAADPASLPAVNAIDLALLARHKDAPEILLELLSLLGGSARFRDPQGLRELIVERMTERNRPWTLVIDGLDEARDPYRLVGDVVIPLAQATDDTGEPLVHLILGLRSAAGTHQNGGPGLLRLLRQSIRQLTELRTDGPGTTDDINLYLDALLSVDGPYAQDTARRADVARTVAEAVTPSFLDARYAGQRLRTGAPVDSRTLQEGTIGLLADDLADVAALDGTPADELLAVLRAAAFALGAGVPRNEIWPTLVEAVLDRELPAPDRLIGTVLESRLSGYLTRDTEDGRTVRRPAHERLAEVLRTEPQRLTHTPTEPEGWVHARIAAALSRLATPALPPHPYLGRYLARHAALGDVLDDAHVPATVLPWETGEDTRVLLGLPVADREDRRVLAAWARIEPFVTGANPVTRELSLNFAAVAFTGTRVPPITPGLPSTRWAHWRQPANILTAADGVRSAVSFSAVDGRPLLATGGAEGRVRIWDPATGAQLSELTGMRGAVCVTAFLSRDGRTLLATGDGEVSIVEFIPSSLTDDDEDGEDEDDGFGEERLEVHANATGSGPGREAAFDGVIRVWDPTTGIQQAALHGHDGAVRDITAFTDPSGRLLLASVGEDGHLRLWDPEAGTLEADLAGHQGPSSAVSSFTRPDGTVLLATTGLEDFTVRIWDPATSTQIAQLTGHQGSVHDVLGFETADGATLLATGGTDGLLRLWDTTDFSPVASLRGQLGSITCMAAPRIGGDVYLVTGGSWFDDMLRVWDPRTGRHLGALPGHRGALDAVTALPDGRVISCGRDGTMRIWEPLRDLEPEPPQPGSDSVTCQAVVEPASGRLLIATGHRDGWVRVWDAETGAKDLEFSTGLSSVEALTGFTAPTGRTLLAVGGQLSEDDEYDGRIRLWDLSTGTEVAALGGHDGGVAQLTTLTRADGTLVLVSGGSQDMTVGFWDIDTGELTAHIELGHGLVSGLLPLRSADGRALLVISTWPVTSGDETPEGHVVLFDLAEGAGDIVMTGPDRVRSVALIPHPEGTLALAVSWVDGGTDVLDFATGSVTSLKGARAETVAAYLSDQGRSVLITGEQDAVVGHDVRTGDEVFCMITGNSIKHVATDTSSGRPILIVGSVNGVALLDLP